MGDSLFDIPVQGVLDLDDDRQLELSLDEEHAVGLRNEARESIDDLVREAQRYRTSASYRSLLRFVSSFRDYAPYNVVLVDIQRPGSTFVATARRWRDRYGQGVHPAAQPLMILRPRGPVMFVFDVSDVRPLETDGPARPLPIEVTDPFAVTIDNPHEVAKRLAQLEENAVGLGIRISRRSMGSQLAGFVETAGGSATLERHRPARGKTPGTAEEVKLRYDVVLNAGMPASATFTALAHELAHILCGHLGTPDVLWWPDRRHLDHDVEEFEAESVAYLAARRIDSAVQMPLYLHQHLSSRGEVPVFSLERVAKVSGYLEEVSTHRAPSAVLGKTLRR